VQEVIGRNTINVSGCPPHPNWVVETLVQLLQGKTISLDNQGRPVSIYGGQRRMCDQCPFEGRGEARTLGVKGQCMEALGCWGEVISAPCPTTQWNNRVNWCIGAGSPCLGCTEPTFPGASLSRRRGRGGPPGRGGPRGPGGPPGRGPRRG